MLRGLLAQGRALTEVAGRRLLIGMRKNLATVCIFGLLFSASLSLFAGCGGGVGADSCNASIECEGGNDADINACIAATEGLANEAAAYDCSDAFDKLIECVDKVGICKSGHYQADCGDEADALSKCEKAASARK